MTSLPEPASPEAPRGQPQAAFTVELLQQLFGGMHKGMAYCRMAYLAGAPADFSVLYANPAFDRLCQPSDGSTQRISALLSNADAIDAGLLKALDGVVGLGETPSFERHLPALGKWLQIDAHRTNPGHFMLILSDVSDKRRAEAVEAESEKRLRAIFDICPVPFCLNDTAGNITFLNRAFQSTFGYTPDDIPTLDAWWPKAYPEPLYRQRIGQTWLAKVDKTRREGSVFETMEAVIRCKDGSLRTVLADAVPMGDAFADTHLVVLYDITDQKEAEKSLAEAERYAQRILGSVGDGLCQLNVLGELTFINPRGAELLGYTPAEMLGQHAPTLFHHSHASGSPYTAAERAGRQTLLLGRAMSVDDEVFWRKDGSSVAVQYTSAPMEVDGEVQGVVLTFRDTSEEQRIRKALLENEVVMRKAQEIAGFGTYVLDMRTGLWESSPQLDALFGIGPDFVRDVAHWNLLVDAEFRDYAQDHLRLVASGKIDFRLDYRITRPSDGAKRWVAGNGEVEFDAQGAPVRLIGSIQDITNRKRIEAELQEGHDLLHKLSKEIPGVLYQFKMSPDGQFSVPFASKGAVDMFGISHEMVKQDASLIFEVVAAEARTAFIDSIRHSAQTLQNWVEEFQVDMPGVGRRWRQGQARPELLEDGSVVWYGFINDITERFESRRQLQQLNENLELHVLERTRELVLALDSAELAKRSRGQFLANVSHEIRTPMNAIMGMVYLLLQNQPGAQQRQYLEKVHQSGVHLLGIINDILDFSKIDAGKLQLDLQSVDLDQFLHQVVHMSEGKANEKGLRLTLDRGPAVPRFIRCDALRLGQILINFLNNASKFTEHGHVTLRVAVLQDSAQPDPATVRLRFAVEDSGMGMNAEQLTRLFQPFVQGDNSTTRKFGGTGLGLAISRELAGLMGGEVGAVSDVDAGSTFWFACRFELAQAPLAMAAPDAAAEHDIAVLRGKRVLVVDDNEFNLDVACDLLTDTGMQVSTASNGLQALELLHRQHFDIVLMDVQMPVMDGHEATRRIRLDAALASTVVLAMTANAGLEDRELCLQAGMDEVLTKPIEPDKMFLALARWIGSVRHAPVVPTLAPLQPAAAGERANSRELPLWDTDALQRLVGNKLATRDRLLDCYLQSAGDTVEAIRTAMRAEQWSAMAGLAHKLKSASRSVGAMQLGRLCEALEHAGPNSSCKNLAEIVIRGFDQAQALIQARPR